MKRTEKSDVLGSSKLKMQMGSSVAGDGDQGNFITKFKRWHSLSTGTGTKDKLLARKLCNQYQSKGNLVSELFHE